jgi:hypothetical protein
LPAEGICSRVLVVPSLLIQFPAISCKHCASSTTPQRRDAATMLVLIWVIPPSFPGCWHPQTYRRPIKFVLRNFECHPVQLRQQKYARSKAVGVSRTRSVTRPHSSLCQCVLPSGLHFHNSSYSHSKFYCPSGRPTCASRDSRLKLLKK